MPSLSQPFRLAVLPKIASLSNYSLQTDYLQVAPDTFTYDTNKVTLGISGSGISQYIINPTPKLLFNIAIPSTNNVTASNISHYIEEVENANSTVTTDKSDLVDKDNMESTEEVSVAENTDVTKRSVELWAYGLVANKSNTLNISVKTTGLDEFSTTPGEIIRKKTIKVDSKVVNIKIFKEFKTIVVVLKNGLVKLFDFDLNLKSSLDIAYNDVQFVQHFTESKQNFLLILSNIDEEKSSVCFKLYQLRLDSDSNQVSELSFSILQDFDLSKSKLSYQFGKLYRLTGSELFVYSLPQCQLLQNISLAEIFPNTIDVSSIKPVANNRLVLAINNVVYLIDTLHRSILAEREFTHVKTFQLLQSATIGDSNITQRTIAIGVSTKSGPTSASALELINIEVGSGTLKDSLGKGVSKKLSEGSHSDLKPLFDENDEKSLIGTPVHDISNVKSFNFNKILADLKSSDTISDFDKTFFESLEIKENHYTENDRFISDQDFIANTIDLIFKKFDTEFPKAFTFLLTHPLFPIKLTVGLLDKLKDHPRLFKQAIVTCPNLPLSELLFQLFTVKNGELTLDISLRVLQDYSRNDVKQEIKKLDNVDIENFIEFIITPTTEEIQTNTPQLFQLLSLVLDSIGLFALKGPLLERLSNYINEQVTIAERSSELWHLLDTSTTPRPFKNAYLKSVIGNKETLSVYSVDYLDI
ncbi:hypothetical protein TBLA_0C04460 [Henningerozyma blattae CBS 6284]|uniref:U3 small nucleolar RNA-associated protein 8 n=1 Tax=Henningerozyma blattae (strain ATCC 34711 / CBS 6284 / DSM 70876 / NBRC 10599 / NRRL Y-10934 / UCD 77-7) TaxID=1071380 RepID=I2H1J1_HENB6|nr:hypothetical protein TBLA_0C04460 [Tetrapisispora blattae CBS 6284]CCH60243.1 hypothetical protein TBLA_0C04460 [Tetrapisispora blattae CBS 6284]